MSDRELGLILLAALAAATVLTGLLVWYRGRNSHQEHR